MLTKNSSHYYSFATLFSYIFDDLHFYKIGRRNDKSKSVSESWGDNNDKKNHLLPRNRKYIYCVFGII